MKKKTVFRLLLSDVVELHKQFETSLGILNGIGDPVAMDRAGMLHDELSKFRHVEAAYKKDCENRCNNQGRLRLLLEVANAVFPGEYTGAQRQTVLKGIDMPTVVDRANEQSARHAAAKSLLSKLNWQYADRIDPSLDKVHALQMEGLSFVQVCCQSYVARHLCSPAEVAMLSWKPGIADSGSHEVIHVFPMPVASYPGLATAVKRFAKRYHRMSPTPTKSEANNNSDELLTRVSIYEMASRINKFIENQKPLFITCLDANKAQVRAVLEFAKSKSQNADWRKGTCEICSVEDVPVVLRALLDKRIDIASKELTSVLPDMCSEPRTAEFSCFFHREQLLKFCSLAMARQAVVVANQIFESTWQTVVDVAASQPTSSRETADWSQYFFCWRDNGGLPSVDCEPETSDDRSLLELESYNCASTKSKSDCSGSPSSEVAPFSSAAVPVASAKHCQDHWETASVESGSRSNTIVSESPESDSCALQNHFPETSGSCDFDQPASSCVKSPAEPHSASQESTPCAQSTTDMNQAAPPCDDVETHCAPSQPAKPEPVPLLRKLGPRLAPMRLRPPLLSSTAAGLSPVRHPLPHP